MNYLDLPVFPLMADLGESVRRTLNYEPEVTDIGFGAQPAMPVQANIQERLQLVTVAPDADALDTVEVFFAARSGRFKAFWLATGAEDVTVLSALVSATMFIEASIFSDWSHLKGKHLAFRSLDGQCLFRKVLLVEATAFATRSRVTLDEALPANADCWQVSRLLLVRLSSDEIEYEFEADNYARIRFTGIELPEEYAAPNAFATRRPVYLYRITRRYGVRDIYSLHLTSHDTPVNSGVTWHPVPIDHSGLSVSTEGDTDKLSLELFAWDGNPFEDWLPIHIGQPTGVVLSLAHVDETTGLVLEAPVILFRGIIESVTRQGYTLKAKAVSPLSYGEKRVPRFFLQTRCNYQLFDGSTCRVPSATYRLTGTIEAIDTDGGSIDFESVSLADKAADWLAGGYIEIGTAPQVEVRTIRYAELLSATRHRLYLNASLRTSEVAANCSAWPGCDRTPDCCKQGFDNFVNYGGHPFIPYENPTLKAMPLASTASSGGKK
jgi:hypothetical protein